ncbi:MAG TPA: hypothetical protein VFI25_16290 [Planctomycetota bacterium]|nr:hypothetical protein [Planctomycetota bacterium]
MSPDPTRSGARLAEVLLAAAAAALLACAFLRETLFDPGKVLGALDHPLAHLPWSARYPSNPPRNPELSDPAIVFDPFLHFLRREVQAGEGLPAWNPHQFCGVPAAGNPQFGHFSPVRSLVHAFPVERSLAFQAAAKLFVALLSAYLLARRLGLSPAASGLAGLGFGLGGYQVLWLLYPLSDVSFLAPAVFLALERWFAVGSRRALAAIAASFGLAALGGHPETAFFLGACAGAHALVRGLARFSQGADAVVRSAGGAILGLALGGLLASISALPALEYLKESVAKDLRAASLPPVRLGGKDLLALLGLPIFVLLFLRIAREIRGAGRFSRAAGWGGALGVLLAALGLFLLGPATLGRLVPALLPDFYGNPVFGPAYEGRTAYLQAAAPYAGLATALLALVSFVAVPGRRLWKGTFLAAFALIGGIPLLSPLLRLLPGLSIAEPSRAAPLANLASALLAGFALDRILGEGRALRHALAGLGACALVAGGAALVVPSPTLPGPAPVPAPWVPGGRLLGFREPKDGSTIGGTRFPLAGWVVGLHEGDRIEVDLDRGEGVRARASAPLDAPAVEGAAGEAGLRGFSGAFEPLLVPEGRYRIVGRILDAAGREAGVFDGGVVALRARGKFPARAGLLAAGLALFLGLAAAGRASPSLARGAIAALVGLDLWLFGNGFNPAGDASRVYPTTKLEEFLREDPDLFGDQKQGRVWTEAGVFPPDVATRLGFLDVRGYDAIDLARFDLFLDALSRNPRLFIAFRTLRDLRTDLPAFDLLGIKVVATPHVYRNPRFLLVWEGENVHVYRNRDFRGLAILSPGVQRASEVTSAEQVDPSRAALVEEDVALESPFAKGEARVVSHSPDRVVVQASLDGEGILTLCENWFPGWTVEVDGKRERLLRTFTTFRGVKLVGGEQRDHEVVFAYRPLSLRIGLALSLAAAAGIFALALLPRRG